jgi:hypothetical protein
MGVGVTHASFAAEVQSETPQVVRFIGFFLLAPSAQPEIAQRQQARDLVEALGGGDGSGVEAAGHRRHSWLTG